MTASKYTYHNSERKTFVEAQSICKHYGGQLASIESEYARDVILNSLKEYQVSYWWIGLQKLNHEWKWSNGRNLNRTIINFTEQDTLSCGCLYQPSGGRLASLYDYGCTSDSWFYICESEPVYDADSQPAEPVQDMNSMAMITSLVSISIVAIIILALLAFRMKRNSTRDETVSSTMEDQQIPRRQNSGASRNNYDDGYATIDGVIYSEIDSVHVDDRIAKNETKENPDSGGVTYAQIMDKSTVAYDPTHQYAKVNKRKKSDVE